MKCADASRDTALSRCVSAAAWVLQAFLNGYDDCTSFNVPLAQRRIVAARRDAGVGCLHAGKALRRASPDGEDHDRVRRGGSVARPRAPREQGLAAGAIAGSPLW